MEPSRRGFLFGLVAAAVATKLPALAVAEQQEVAHDITTQLLKLTINGAPPQTINILDVGNGWFRVSGTSQVDPEETISIGVAPGWRDPDGMFVGEPKYCEHYAHHNPGKLAFSAVGVGPGNYTFSIYYKPSNRDYYGAQLEGDPIAKAIETRAKEKYDNAETTNLVLWSEGKPK